MIMDYSVGYYVMGSSQIIKTVSKKTGFSNTRKKVRVTDWRIFPLTSNLSKNEKLDPKRVHDGGGCVSHNGINRGPCRNLADSCTGNNMGRASVDQILPRGPACSVSRAIIMAEELRKHRPGAVAPFWRQFFATAIAPPPPLRQHIVLTTRISRRPLAARKCHWIWTVSADIWRRTI